MYNCLMRVAHEADFSAKCKTMLSGVQEKRLLDWTMDVALHKACAADAATMCSSQLSSSEGDGDDGSTAENGTGDVLSCLIQVAQAQQAQQGAVRKGQGEVVVFGGRKLSAACNRHITRTSLMALQFYKPVSFLWFGIFLLVVLCCC